MTAIWEARRGFRMFCGAAGLSLALLPVVQAADLEVSDPRGPRPPVQANPNFPYQYPMYGQLLQFSPTADTASALRDKIAKHADRPVLVLVAPDGNLHPSQNFRVVWLGNLLHSPNDDVQRMLGQVEVAVAQAGTLRTILADVRTDALAYLIGSRDGKPFAWALGAATPTEAALLQAFGPGVFTGKDVADRAARVRNALEAKARGKIDAAVKELGDDSYEKREAASRALAAHMPDIGPWVQSLIETSPDVEVRSRCAALLSEAGRAWQKKAPTGCTWTNANQGVRFGRGAILQAQPAVLQLKIAGNAAVAVQEAVADRQKDKDAADKQKEAANKQKEAADKPAPGLKLIEVKPL